MTIGSYFKRDLLGRGAKQIHGAKTTTTRLLSNNTTTSTADNTTATASDNTVSKRPKPIRNEGLAQVKVLGMPFLEATTLNVLQKTRAPLFLPESEMGPSPNQLAEANRVFGVVSQVVETFARRDTTFSIKGEPIVIMQVEVSKDLKQARVYWTLPFSVMRYDQHVVEEVKKRMQVVLETRGGKLQRLVHAQLRSYYPPKLRFVPSPDDLFDASIRELANNKSKPASRLK